MKKIEITEPGGILHAGQRFELGDVRTVDDALANYFIQHGWAKCVATGEQGERVPGASNVVPAGVIVE